jgi:hypothetical protein
LPQAPALLAVCLVQMVKPTRLLLLLRTACERVCLSDRAKLAAPLPRPEPLDLRQRLAADFRLRERQRL